MLWWIIAFVLTILVIFYKYSTKQYEHWKKYNVPYMKPWPFFGNAASLLFRRETTPKWMDDIYNYSEDRRYVGLYMLLDPVLVIKDLNLIKQICIKEFDHFTDHQSFIPEDIAEVFGKNLFSLKGQKWKHMRSTLSPAFTGNKMRAMFVLISESATLFADYFSKKIDSSVPLTIEMKDAVTRFTNDVIATTAFGIQCNSLTDKNNDFYRMGKELTDFSGVRFLKLAAYFSFPRLVKALKVKMYSDEITNYFRDIIVGTMRTREEQGIIRPDMIHLLMEARKGKLRHEEVNKSEDDAGFATVQESDIGSDISQALLELSDDDITAQAMIFFFAGFESISLGICHMAYELALNEDVQSKLQEEIDTALEKCNGKVTYEVLMNMRYMDMVVSENLRKWPVVFATDRVCVDPYTIPAENPDEKPIHIKKGDRIWIVTYGLHRDPKYFPDPDRFDPERFSEENKSNIQPYSYMPFGIGPRNCIGSRFALMEIKIIFLHMLAKFNFVIVEKSQVPLRITKSKGNLDSENGFWLGLKKRK